MPAATPAATPRPTPAATPGADTVADAHADAVLPVSVKVQNVFKLAPATSRDAADGIVLCLVVLVALLVVEP